MEGGDAFDRTGTGRADSPGRSGHPRGTQRTLFAQQTGNAGHETGSRSSDAGTSISERTALVVQVTWIGYPNSTGLTQIDYRITDVHCDPEETTQVIGSHTMHSLLNCSLSTVFLRGARPAAPLFPVLHAVHRSSASHASSVSGEWIRDVRVVQQSRQDYGRSGQSESSDICLSFSSHEKSDVDLVRNPAGHSRSPSRSQEQELCMCVHPSTVQSALRTGGHCLLAHRSAAPLRANQRAPVPVLAHGHQSGPVAVCWQATIPCRILVCSFLCL